MDELEFLQGYGWLGVILWLGMAQVWPVVRDHLLPERAAERRRREEAEEAARRREEALLERQVVASERIGEALQHLVLGVGQLDQRATRIEADGQFVRDGVGVLLERTAPRGRARKAPPPAPE